VSRQIVASAGAVYDVNSTCDVLHVARAAQFNSSEVLKQIVAAQQLLASGTTLPASVNAPFGAQSGAAWLGEDSSDVMSCSWSKDIDGVVGTVSIQLKPRTEYLETILPGDILFVFMSDAGGYDPDDRFSGTLVTVAIVDRVAEPTTVQQHATVEVVNVSARDFGVVLSESSTVFDQAFAQIENAAFTGEFISRLFGEKKQLALSPLENVLILLLLLYDSNSTGSALASLQWKLAASSEAASPAQLISLLDVTTYVQNPLPFYAIAEPPGIIQAGNVWSLLESYANPVVNEFFVDVRDVNPQERKFRELASANAKAKFYSGNPVDVANQDAAVRAALNSDVFRQSATRTDSGSTVPGSVDGTSVVALVMRQRPYDADAFNALPFTEVDSTEIETFEPARSSHDVFNWFRVRFPGLDVKLQELVAGIRTVPQSIAKFGFRRMEAETRYMFSSSDASVTFNKGSTKTDFGDVFRAYIDLLSTWYSQNEFWYAGSLSMRFKPSIRIGTRFRLTRRGRVSDYYVQGVHHSFAKDPGASRSTFTLTRGRVVNSATVPLIPVGDFQHDGFGISEGSQ
jgi:hypothetical protein